MDTISTLAADWFNLGVALRLSYDTLKTIESNYPRDAPRCLTEMVIAWLQIKDNAQPSWQSLASALRSPLVNRIEIATMIAAEHPPHNDSKFCIKRVQTKVLSNNTIAYLQLFLLPGASNLDQPQSVNVDDAPLGKCMTVTQERMMTSFFIA